MCVRYTFGGIDFLEKACIVRKLRLRAGFLLVRMGLPRMRTGLRLMSGGARPVRGCLRRPLGVARPKIQCARQPLNDRNRALWVVPEPAAGSLTAESTFRRGLAWGRLALGLSWGGRWRGESIDVARRAQGVAPRAAPPNSDPDAVLLRVTRRYRSPPG